MQSDPYATRSFKRDRIAWVVMILFVVVSCAGVYVWLHRRVIPPYELKAADDPAIHKEPRFAVLAYDRIIEEGGDGIHIDEPQFREHMTALQRSGFTPVSLSMLLGFFYQGKSLPSRPFLLTFDHGYFETYTVVDDILQEMKWQAVMFITSRRQVERDTNFVYWDRLQRMVDSGIWEIGSGGHMGNYPYHTGEVEKEGWYLSAWRLLEEAGHRETSDEFTTQARSDYDVDKRAIEMHLRGYKPLAFVLPSYNPPKDTEWRKVDDMIRPVLEDLYLGFVDDRFGVNDRSSNPYRLKRLRVNPRWSGEELVKEISNALSTPPVQEGLSQAVGGPPAAWVTGDGQVRMVNNGAILLDGAPRADIWLSGSQWVDDWVMELDILIDKGQFWISEKSPETYDEWRFGGEGRTLSIQRRKMNGPFETLAHFSADAQPGKWHHVKLIKRALGVWVEWDGMPLAERPTYLPDTWRGYTAVIAWDQIGNARLTIERLSFAGLLLEPRVIDGAPSKEAVQGLINDAPSIGVVSPRWIEVDGDRLHETPIEWDLFSIISRRYGWEIIPTVRVRDSRGVVGEHADIIRSLEERILMHTGHKPLQGIYFDLRYVPPPVQDAWGHALEDLQKTFQKKGLKLLISGIYTPHGPAASDL